MRRLLLLCLLPLAACGGEAEEAAAPPPAPPATAPSDLETPVEPVPLAPDSGVVADIDPAFLMRATLSRDGRQYRLDQAEGEWTLDGTSGAEVGAWLDRYAPLRADGRATGIVPDSLIFSPDAQVSFFFTDGSGRVVSFGRYGDSLAVVARPNGPVYRLAPSRLDALVPPPEAF